MGEKKNETPEETDVVVINSSDIHLIKVLICVNFIFAQIKANFCINK